ncbi:hypothetical protein [Nitrosomonas marina]|uniref:Cytochrome C n=1 Tax=Nitrosomonas marina TaxID=917 RepID=A0A1H8F642_9PROT|nr:hypothetical protein [Nitrosomonas marina]SEN27273.1 hypothetical protein SAMN05216325_11218 [Nitrosomonas marina]
MKIVIACIFSMVVVVAQANDSDKRQILEVNAMQRMHILEEMRALLSGTQQILYSLSEENMTAVAQHAQSLGTRMTHKAEGQLGGVLPGEFMQLGMSVHRDFDQIAMDAESLKNPRHTLGQLSETMKKCVACHATYQVQTRYQSDAQNLKSSH